MVKAKLMGTTSDHLRVYLASREAQRRRLRVSKLDKIYTKLMLGSRAERRVDKAGKLR